MHASIRDMASETVYVSIGNTDGRLSLEEWAQFFRETNDLMTGVKFINQVYGVWHSLPGQPYMNACWAVRVSAVNINPLREALRQLAKKFRQESIAFSYAHEDFVRT